MASLDEKLKSEQLAYKTRALKMLSLLIAIALSIVLLISLGNYFFSANDSDVRDVNTTRSVNNSKTAEKLTVATDNDSRAALQKSLSETRKELNLLVEDPVLSRWKEETLHNLQQELQQAYDYYASNQYVIAAELLLKIQAQAKAYQQAFNDALQQAHSSALAAFNNANLTQANLYNRETLQIKPDFVPALQLQQRLGVAEVVSDLWSQVRIAELENNRAKEVILLEEILKKDPSDNTAQTRLKLLTKVQSQQEFANVFAEAVSAFEQQNYAVARLALRKAEQLNSNRPEIKALLQKLNQAEQENTIAVALEQINNAIAADDWSAVQDLTNKALNISPNHPDLQKNAQQALRMLDAELQLGSFLQRPERLTDTNIQQRAKSLLAEIEPLGHQSPKLMAQAKKLANLLDLKQRTVAVRIFSDEKTYIRILGVGNVGEVKEKIIQLQPGDYQFEGVCKGYRTEMINVKVPAVSEPVQVRLQCQVRI